MNKKLGLFGSSLLCILILFSGCSDSLKYENYTQSGISMEPTINDNTEVEIAMGYSAIRNLKRGDIILFKYPNNPDLTFIKRIIALPGEVIEIKNGKVYIDNSLLNESYITPPATTLGTTKSMMENKEYFVMGDNRSYSSDSRQWGPVSEDLIIGKVQKY